MLEKAVAGKRYNSITIPLEDVPQIFYKKISQLSYGPIDNPTPLYLPSERAGGGATPPDSISLNDDDSSTAAPPTAISKDVPPTVISKDVPPIVVSKEVPLAGFHPEQPRMPRSPRVHSKSTPITNDDLVEQLLDAVERAASKRRSTRKQQADKIQELQTALTELKRTHAAMLAKAAAKQKKDIEFEGQQRLKRLETEVRQKEKEIKQWQKQHQLDTDRLLYAKER